MAPKAAAGGGGNGTGNMTIISGSTPGGTTSISRVDLSRSGGSVGSMEKVKPEMRVVVSNSIPIVSGKMKKRGIEHKC